MHKFICIILGVGMLLSCRRETEKYMPDWGLKSVEVRRRIEFRKEACDLEILFEPRLSSKKYELRLFYPSIDPAKRTLASIDSVEGRILELLDGFGYSVYDSKTNALIRKYSVNKATGFSALTFNRNTPLSLWMDVKINFRKARKYKILLDIPPNRDAEAIYSDVVFVVGIAHDTFL